MDYTKHYCALVFRAKAGKQPKRRKGNGAIGEWHHILPASEGGTDDEYNMVFLTHREHIFAHRCLARMYPKNFGLSETVMFMARSRGSRSYAADRTRAAEAQSERERGRIKTPDHVRKIMESRTKNGTHGGWHRPEIHAVKKAQQRDLANTTEWRASKAAQMKEFHARRRAAGLPYNYKKLGLDLPT